MRQRLTLPHQRPKTHRFNRIQTVGKGQSSEGLGIIMRNVRFDGDKFVRHRYTSRELD
jgi:hypothetical protein